MFFFKLLNYNSVLLFFCLASVTTIQDKSAKNLKLRTDLKEKTQNITFLKNKVYYLKNLLRTREVRNQDLGSEFQSFVNQRSRVKFWSTIFDGFIKLFGLSNPTV